MYDIIAHNSLLGRKINDYFEECILRTNIIKLSEKLSENPNIIKNTCIHVEVMAINSNY